MFESLRERWADWTGDKRLTEAIQRELRRGGYAVHSAQIRRVQLTAIERPGWVQVYEFYVETSQAGDAASPKQPTVLYGVSREDGRQSFIKVCLTDSLADREQQLAEWSEGLIVRRRRSPDPL